MRLDHQRELDTVPCFRRVPQQPITPVRGSGAARLVPKGLLCSRTDFDFGLPMYCFVIVYWFRATSSHMVSQTMLLVGLYTCAPASLGGDHEAAFIELSNNAQREKLVEYLESTSSRLWLR